MTPEQLIALQRLQSLNLLPMEEPRMAPPVPPPPAGQMYRDQANTFLGQAGDLEKQAAAPMARPQGFKENLVNAARAFVEGMARPQDPYAEQRRREDVFRDEQQNLVARARALRGDAAQQQQLGETAQLRDIQQQQEDRLTAADKRPELMNMGQGTLARVPKETGAPEFFSAPGYPQKGGGSANLQLKQANLKNGRKAVPVNYDTDGTQGPPGRIYAVTGEDVTDQVERLFDPVVMPGFNPATQTPEFTPRQDVTTGSTGNVPLPTQGALDAADESKKAVANINNIGGLFRDNFVGPIMGRYQDLKTLVPERIASLPEGYADFAAANSALKSDVIKAITGAQMNLNEEKRILASVPLGTDRGDVWLSKYQQLKNRINVIAALKQQRIGASSYTLEQLDDMAAGRLQLGANPGAPPAPRAPAGNTTPVNQGGGGTSDAIRRRLGLPPRGQ